MATRPRSRAALENSQRVLTQQALLMPHLPNGDADWNTLGKILTASIVGEVLCASYIDQKHRMARPQFDVDTDWRYAYEERGVVVLRKKFPDSPFHCWMGRAIIEHPLKEIADFIQDPTSATLYDKYITQSRHIKVLSETDRHKDVIAYYFTETRECLMTAKRDLLFFLRHTHFDDKYVMTAMSVDHPECPPLEGVPRAQLQAGSGWHLEKHMGSSSRTLVSYVVHTDLMELPPIISNRVLKRQPMNIFYLKRELMQLSHQHQQQLSTRSLSQSQGETCQSKSYSGRHFEDPLSISVFTSRPRVNLREGREKDSEGTDHNSSQSCWHSAKPSIHSDRFEEDTLTASEEHQRTLELTESS